MTQKLGRGSSLRLTAPINSSYGIQRREEMHMEENWREAVRQSCAFSLTGWLGWLMPVSDSRTALGRGHRAARESERERGREGKRERRLCI